VEDVVAEDEASRGVVEKLPSKEKRLCETLRPRLFAI
jgi:hypothetical protein